MGFLSNTLEDDQNIANAGSAPGEGTNELPAPGAFANLFGGIGQGVEGGFENAARALSDATDATFGYFPNGESAPVGANPNATTLLPTANVMAGPESEFARTRQQYLDDTIAQTKLDPRTTGSVGMFAGQTAKGLTEAGLGSVAGPWGAAALIGGTSFGERYHDLRSQGVGQNTALADAGIVGATNAAFALFPVKFGGSLVAGTAKAVGAGVGLGVTSRFLQSTVLAANGYDQMADMVRPFDTDSILSDAVMTGFFNAAGHFGAKLRGKKPKVPIPSPSEVDAAQAAQVETHYNDSGFGIPTDPATANLHTDTLAAHIDAMSRDMDPAPVDPAAAQALAEGVIVDPQPLALAQAIHEVLNADPDVAAVRAAPELPGEADIPMRRAGERLQRFDELDARQQAGDALTPDETAELLDLHDLNRTTAVVSQSGERMPGVGNRLALDRAQAADNAPGHVAMIDVDNFKKINDEQGYTAGNEAIARVAAQLVRSYRGAARVFHLSGDEFAVLGHDEQALREGHAEAEKYLGEQHGIKISAGFGRSLDDAEAGLKTEKAARLAAGKRTTRDASDVVPGGAIPADREAGASRDRNTGNGQAASGGKDVRNAVGLRAGERGAESSYSGNAVTDEILNRLVADHGQELVTLDDGSRVTIAQLAGEQRQQFQEAEHASGLIDVAVACFLRTGGAQ